MNEVDIQTLLKLYHEDKTHGEIALKTKLSRTAVASRLQRYFRKHPQDQRRKDRGNGGVKLQPIQLVTAISEVDFLKPFDWVQRLREGLEKLSPGTSQAVIRDDDFRRHLGIPQDKWRKLKKMDEFTQYQMTISNQATYWCQPETRNKLMSRIELADEVM